MTNKLRMALVGCGGIASSHWRGIKYLAPRIEVTAVVDSNPAVAEAWSKRTGAKAFTELGVALESQLFESVDLMLPHDVHIEAAEACFHAGKHVVLEKPMAMDVAGAERILAAAKQAGVILMVAEQAQYWPDIHKARELMDGGEIGEVITARGCFYDSLVLDSQSPVPWRFDLSKAGGGIVIDGGAHWIRPLRLLLGEIDSVVAVMGSHIPRMEGESWSHALLRFETGLTATFDAYTSYSSVGPTEDFRISGSEGELVIERGPGGHLKLFNVRHPEGLDVMDSYQGKVDSYGKELQDFSSTVLDGSPLSAEPEFSLGELRTALAIYRSVQSGRWESVWSS